MKQQEEARSFMSFFLTLYLFVTPFVFVTLGILGFQAFTIRHYDALMTLIVALPGYIYGCYSNAEKVSKYELIRTFILAVLITAARGAEARMVLIAVCIIFYITAQRFCWKLFGRI